ncbi:MAG TPA: PVC-type heme-binding CxxCH protein [Pirellulaceae bacterium]|jgi:putative heme-binding domain-containing protein|nr:PVC-type heme-binding CxxCH protein [Pirellulaceae bacterium]
MRIAACSFAKRPAAIGLFASSLFFGSALIAQQKHVQETEPLSPAEALKSFHLPEGFTIELVASEPLIAKPINLQFDAKGRLLVTTTTDYPYAQVDNPGDQLQILEDRDGDGSFETVAGEVEDLTIPIGVTPVGRDVVVYGIPNIYRVSEPDGDGVYQEKKVLFGPLGYADTHGMQNGFVRGYDGWIYACHGFKNDSTFVATDGSRIELNSGNTYRFRPDGSRVEVVSRGQVNPFGMAFDEWGNQYTADCHTQPLYQLIPGAYYPSFGKPHDGLGYGPTLVEHSHGSTGIAGVAFLNAEHVPEEFRGDPFICNPITHRVNRDKIFRNGASFRGQEMPDFLTCDDPWFRPVDIQLGPDGCLYVADFYNRIIGHYEVPLDHPGRDRTSGRIWRISYGAPKNRQQTDFTKLSLDELWNELDSANSTRRLIATHELVDRLGDEAAKKAADSFDTASERQKVSAIWILHRTTGIDESFVAAAAMSSPVVRGHLVTALRDRSEEDWQTQPWIAQCVVKSLSDEEPMVRRLAAQALAYHPRGEWFDPLMVCWMSAQEDAYLGHALKIAVRNSLASPGGFDAARRFRATAAASELPTRRFLIDAALGVEDAAAAEFLLEHGRATQIDDAQVGAVGAKIGRWLPAERDAEIEAWLAGFEEKIPRDWPNAIQSVARGAQMSGRALSDSLSRYGKQVCQMRLASDDGSLTASLLDTAIQFGWKLDGVALMKLIAEDRPLEVREKACTLLARSDANAFNMMAAYALTNPDLAPALRKRMVVTLATLDDADSGQLFAAGLTAMPYSLAHETIREAGYSADRVRFLVESMQAGKLPDGLLREKDVQEGIRQSGVAEAIAFLDERLPKLPPLDQELDRRIATLASKAVYDGQSIEKGALLFEQKCGKCHQLAGKGEKIGPQLDGVGHRGSLRLLEDILDPNRNVDPAFRSTTFVMADGQVKTALVVKEEGETITLADPEGKLSTVAAGDVEERRTSSLSPMPANWREVLTDEELVELTRFLASQAPR